MKYRYSAKMQSFAFFSLVLASILAIPSLAVTLTDVSQLETLAYDYIIVGGMYTSQDSQEWRPITNYCWIAGNAGLVIANRLTENSNVSVLVLEAGVTYSLFAVCCEIPCWLFGHYRDQGVIAAEAPFLGPTLTPSKFNWIIVSSTKLMTASKDTLWDWNYTVVAQPGMKGRTFPYPRGKLLGGSSSASEQTSRSDARTKF